MKKSNISIQFTNNILFILLFSLISNFSYATHVPGANISYKWLAKNTYEITLTLYEDCETAFTSNSNMSINVVNSCGIPFASTISLQNIVFQQEISQLCDDEIQFSECNGGNLPGILMHKWRGTVVLPNVCDSWIFSYRSCCRNNSNNLSGMSSYYVQAVLNSQTGAINKPLIFNNSSPIITNEYPIPYLCVGQTVAYNLGIYDSDGDSLSFSFISPMTSSNGFVSYEPGYSANSPINGISLNNFNGDIILTPNIVGNFVIAILVEEYNSNGNLVGSIIYDFTIEVINCSNFNPQFSNLELIPNCNLNSSQKETIIISEGTQGCFDIEFTDLNSTDSIFITSSNLDSIFQNGTATLIQTTFFSPATAQICITANIGMDTLSFLNISVKDNACPIFGINSKTIKIEVTPASYSNASSTDIICAGNDDGSITLNPIGNYGPPWKIDLINPITYNIIQNDSNIYASYTFNNLSQGVYIVRSTDTNNCYIDTLITINEPDSITINLSPDTDICLNDSTILRAYGQDGVAPYTYSWVDFQNSDSSQLISPTVSNYYSVFAIDNLGCISSTDSIFIELLSSPTSLFTADPNITSIFNPEVIFTNASSNDVVSYYWQFFNSDSIQIGTSSQINPIYTFPNSQAGEYYTVLTVTNSNNCSDIYNLPIIIENAAFNIFVPNAFTPDGDGINDYLFVQGENLVTNNFNLIIFDKWGEKVFETNDVNEKWDGNYKNKPAQQDAYVWKIKITDPITSELKELNGHVLLMR